MLGKYCVGNEMSAQLMSYVKVRRLTPLRARLAFQLDATP
jgi:hypothetical protein